MMSHFIVTGTIILADICFIVKRLHIAHKIGDRFEKWMMRTFFCGKKLPCIIVHYYCHMCVLTFQVFWGVPFHGVHEKHNSNTLLFVRDASLYTQHSSHTVCHVSGRPRKSASWALHNILRYNVNIPVQLGLIN